MICCCAYIVVQSQTCCLVLCRDSVPGVILAAHGVVHIGFVGLAGLVPGWCLQQQMKRIQVLHRASYKLHCRPDKEGNTVLAGSQHCRTEIADQNKTVYTVYYDVQ